MLKSFQVEQLVYSHSPIARPDPVMSKPSARGIMERIDEESTGSGDVQRESTKASARVASRHCPTTGYDAGLSAEWEAAAIPSGPVVHIRLMADACRQGRATVSTRIPEPSHGTPSSCRLERRPPQPASSPAYPVKAGDSLAWIADERRAAAARRAIADEEETRAAIARFRPFMRVAAGRATTPRSESPDPYGLRRYGDRSQDL